MVVERRIPVFGKIIKKRVSVLKSFQMVKSMLETSPMMPFTVMENTPIETAPSIRGNLRKDCDQVMQSRSIMVIT